MQRLRLLKRSGPSFLTQNLTKYRQHVLEQKQQLRVSRLLKTRIQLSTDPLRDIGRTSGDKRLRGVRWTLNNLGISRSEDQLTFHNAFVHATLRQIYADSWAEHSVRVMEQEQITKIRSEVLIMTPRRWGKTWSVAMFVTALLLNVPGIKIACFSTGKRASGSLMEIVGGMITKVEGGYERIIRRTQEHLYISSVALSEGVTSNSARARALCDAPDTSRFVSYPATVNGQFRVMKRFIESISFFILHF